MVARFFDAHAHVQLAQFSADRDEVLARMRERGVAALVPGVDRATSEAAIALATEHEFLSAAVGLHPNDNREEVFDMEAFATLAAHPNVVAIGECGLDYYRNEPSEAERIRQHARFKKHLELSLVTRKPLIVHCRPTQGTQNAHEEMLELLAAAPHARAVIHFFTAPADIATRYLTLGCYVSFPGPVTYTGMYDDSIRVVPLDRILTETDSPFAAPVPHRGARNEPVYVEEVVRKIAALKGLSFEEMSRHSVENANSVFFS